MIDIAELGFDASKFPRVPEKVAVTGKWLAFFAEISRCSSPACLRPIIDVN
jgi:hypothetical protein